MSQTTYRIDPFSVIRRYLDTQPMDCDLDCPRSDLVKWVRKEFPRFSPGEVTLAVDCLIAVGIGDEYTQFTTVYATAEGSYSQQEINSDAQHRYTGGESKKFYENS